MTMDEERRRRQRELWAVEIARTLDPGAGGYFHAMLKRAALAGMEKENAESSRPDNGAH